MHGEWKTADAQSILLLKCMTWNVDATGNRKTSATLQPLIPWGDWNIHPLLQYTPDMIAYSVASSFSAMTFCTTQQKKALSQHQHRHRQLHVTSNFLGQLAAKRQESRFSINWHQSCSWEIHVACWPVVFSAVLEWVSTHQRTVCLSQPRNASKCCSGERILTGCQNNAPPRWAQDRAAIILKWCCSHVWPDATVNCEQLSPLSHVNMW